MGPNKEFMVRFDQAKKVFTASLEMYNIDSCQCAYPRFQQIIGIDCVETRNSYKCYDTDLLIDLAKPYFVIQSSKLKDENTNEKWVCKKCGSTFEYGWSDFSIHVDRQKLKLTNLAVTPKGQLVIKPIPLYLGLMGHSYPPGSEITTVDFISFQNYMSEK